MRNAETTLTIIQDRGQRGLHLEDLYRQLYNQDLYLRAYGRIYKNAGAMTQGTDSETVDGMSLEKIDSITNLLRYERYRWTPVRRTYIPKKDGRQRPLGIPTWSDKLLQEVMRSILEAYYEPQFSSRSHGFRPERGCHTALRDIYGLWSGTKWFIEGDIKGCFDNINHTVLMSILREKIHDNRFLILIENLLKAGYLEQWDYRPTYSGTPQGGIISPLLANIYLDRLDKFVEQTLIPKHTSGKYRRNNPEYEKLRKRIRLLQEEKAPGETLKPLFEEWRGMRSKDQFDPNFRRLRYIRYADDFLLGFDGPISEAKEIKEKLREFLRDHLKLELSEEKTLITHAQKEKAKFLGYHVSIKNDPDYRRRGISGHIELRMPLQALEEKVSRYTKDGEPASRTELKDDEDFSIVAKYGSEYRGIVQYYAYAKNRFWLHRLHWVMRKSLLKTLAGKHKTTSRKLIRKRKIAKITDGNVTGIQVTMEREGKRPLIARFERLLLKPNPNMEIKDGIKDRDRTQTSRNELVKRLLADECELCGSQEDIEVHHIRKLADLKVKGRAEKPFHVQVMSARRRKTLVVCRACHNAIHEGKPTRKPLERTKVTGEPDDGKLSRPVRRGVDGKGPRNDA